jgi:hypothetical protein
LPRRYFIAEHRATALILCLLLALCLGCEPAVRERTFIAVDPPAARVSQPGPFVFAYFVGNGEDGLHLATSVDGLTWLPVAGGRAVLTPAVGRDRLLRDPSLARGPDGVYHLVWTVSWEERVIGHARSTDLVHWSAQQEIPVMAHEPGARNTWAPEVFYDAPVGAFLIVWASTVAGRCPETAGSSEDGHNHRLYCTTTRDFETFTPTRLYYDPGFSVIDGFVVRAGGRYLLVAKNETRYPEPAKTLFLAAARAAEGPFGPPGPPISAAWVEGPCLLQVGTQWRLYYDRYRDGAYGALVTSDFRSWVEIDGLLAMPPGARHGTMVAVPQSIHDGLRGLGD